MSAPSKWRACRLGQHGKTITIGQDRATISYHELTRLHPGWSLPAPWVRHSNTIETFSSCRKVRAGELSSEEINNRANLGPNTRKQKSGSPDTLASVEAICKSYSRHMAPLQGHRAWQEESSGTFRPWMQADSIDLHRPQSRFAGFGSTMVDMCYMCHIGRL